MADVVGTVAAMKALHRHAMDATAQAIQARRHGETRLATAWLYDAVDLETSAANLATSALDRAVLYRSAATLALEAGQSARARDLALRGLEGSPPEAIADELRGVLGRC